MEQEQQRPCELTSDDRAVRDEVKRGYEQFWKKRGIEVPQHEMRVMWDGIGSVGNNVCDYLKSYWKKSPGLDGIVGLWETDSGPKPTWTRGRSFWLRRVGSAYAG